MDRYLAQIDIYDELMADLVPAALFSNYLREMVGFLDEESRRYSADDLYYSDVVSTFESILLRSLLVNLYTALESCLVRMCVGCEFPRRADKIVKAVHFLVHDKPVCSSLLRSPEGKEIDHYRTLRNCLAHDDGKVTERTSERAKLEQYIRSKYPLLSLSYGSVYLSRDFCEEAIDVTHRFSVAVFVESRKTKAASRGKGT